MTRIVLSFAVAGALAATPAAQAAKPNFTGTWTLDLSKSDFGPSAPPESMVLVVEHKEPTVKVKSTQKSADGEVSNDRTLTTDGKPNLNNINMLGTGPVPVTSTSKWDGAKLVTTYPLNMQGTSMTFVDAWTITGNVLTINRQVTMAEGTFNLTTVFNKK